MRELEFFGEVTAGVTHQIKNELSVIKETGSLIVDLMSMAELGGVLDPGRIKTLAQRVVKRVDRSNLMIKKLNSFAHSAEEETDRADALRILELMIGLYERKAGFNKVSLALDSPSGESRLEVGVRPLLLERILWAALEAAVGAARPDSLVRAVLDLSGERTFLGLTGEYENPPALPPRELMDGSSVEAETESGALFLRFPSIKKA